ncbi:MAG: class II aldolase/adducin family protein [Leptospiraceae bacterium]|nr:class II aldolase/adducin family protein [Leptospiraceae bacterium]
MGAKEGIIKFRYDHTRTELPPVFESKVAELEAARSVLHQKKYIGLDSNGMGYGNLSVRIDAHMDSLHTFADCAPSLQGGFLISGSQTAHLTKLTRDHYVLVQAFSLGDFYLQACGAATPSSESLSHAAVYLIDPDVRAIIHIHKPDLWQYMLDHAYPATGAVDYGSMEMAQAVQRLFDEGAFREHRALVMDGHFGGVIGFGSDPQNALQCILDLERVYDLAHRSDSE